MLLFKDTTFSTFFNITGYDVYTFFSNYISFLEGDSKKIVDYYAGNLKVADSYAFKKLDDLLKEAKTIEEIIYLNKEAFTSVADWNVLDQIEDIIKNLDIISRSYKFLRSPVINFAYSDGIQSDYGLKQNETLERVSRVVLNDTEFDNNWADIAVKNNLREEDYTSKGGVLLKVIFNKTYDYNVLFSVVDRIEGEKMYGLDFDKTITFVNEDLKVLSYKDTITQACNILCFLKVGDVPEFPSDGVSSNVVVGSNLKSIAFPILFRQYYNLFAKDDTFSSFSITNVGFDQDALFIEAEIRTTYGDLLLNKKIYFNK